MIWCEPLENLLPIELWALMPLTNHAPADGEGDPGQPLESELRFFLECALQGDPEPGALVIRVRSLGTIGGWSFLLPSGHDPDEMEVGVYVHPAKRRRGLGRILTDRALVETRRAGFKRIRAFPWSTAGSNLFRRAGIWAGPGQLGGKWALEL